MAYKINGTEVIDDSGELVNFSAFTINDDARAQVSGQQD